MHYLSSLYLPGAVTLWCALIFALAALWGYVQALRGDDSAREFARRAYGFFAAAIVLTAWVMFILLLRRDFRIQYVYSYSGLDLPWFYQLTAFWAGQKGSFLIWLFWGALLGLPLRRAARKAEAPVMGVYLLTLLGLLFILVRENPFMMLAQTPPDGKGLNPLLQNNWMVIHPPIMFIGYAASAIPFSFAISALWRRDTTDWSRRAFPWALLGFLVLGTAILMGGYWAYTTLGWGGYWGWDPVENSSLIPFIFATALIHGLYMERTRGRFRRVNFVFAGLWYMSVLYGTFLTRSGVLADFSVHSFVDLGISGWLIGLMAFFGLTTLFLLITRLRTIPTSRNEDPLLSRGSFLMLASIAFIVSGVVITFGTSAPLLTAFLKNPGQVGPDFYNRVNLPIAVLIAFLLSLVPYLKWKGTPLKRLLRAISIPAVLAVAAAGVAVHLGVTNPLHVAFVLLAALALGTNFQRTAGLIRRGALRQAGGYLAHIGVGMMFIGFLASSAYDHSTKVTLVQGQPQQVGDLNLTFVRFVPHTTPRGRDSMLIKVVRPNGSTYNAYPEMFLNQRTQQLMVHPHVRTLPLQDLYISPIEFDPGTAANAPRQVELRQGESTTLNGYTIHFVRFDLHASGNALAEMQSGKPVTVGAVVQIQKGDGEVQELHPVYRFFPNGDAEAPPVQLSGGELVRIGAINTSASAIHLDVVGMASPQKAKPAELAVDVSHKPLIQLVWFGLYVVLAGGLLAISHRLGLALEPEQEPT